MAKSSKRSSLNPMADETEPSFRIICCPIQLAPSASGIPPAPALPPAPTKPEASRNPDDVINQQQQQSLDHSSSDLHRTSGTSQQDMDMASQQGSSFQYDDDDEEAAAAAAAALELDLDLDLEEQQQQHSQKKQRRNKCLLTLVAAGACAGVAAYFTTSTIVNVKEQRQSQSQYFIDSDNDGLSDAVEERLGTDPFNADTDGDGKSDGEEVEVVHMFDEMSLTKNLTNTTYFSKSSKAPKCPKSAKASTNTNATSTNGTKVVAEGATGGCSDPNVTSPNVTSPNVTDPNATDPNATDPNATDPNATDPNATDPNATDPTRRLSGLGYEINGESIYPNVRRLLSWFLGIETMSEGAEEDDEMIDVEEVSRPFEFVDWTMARECDAPEPEQSDNPAAWNYYDGLIEKNRHIASLARSVKEYAPKRGLVEDILIDAELQEDEDDEDVTNKNEAKSFIPRRLLFTHKEDLLNCDVSSSEPSLHTMAHNVHDTIKAYSEVWGDDMEYDFLTDVECRKAIYETEPELLVYYDDLEGMFKGDICRSAYLYLNGG
jgi:hypothetical protein